MKLYKSYFLAKLMYLTRALVLFAFVNADTNCFIYDDNYSSWNSAGFTDPIGFIKFIQQMQVWIAENNKEAIASSINYPLDNPKIKNKTEFLKNYDIYINNNVKKALREQDLQNIFRNYQGAMIGNGQVWFRETKLGYKIVAINYKELQM